MTHSLDFNAIPAKNGRVVIFGTGDLAQIAYEYFTYDSPYTPAAFVADDAYLPESPFLLGKPVVPFSKVEEFYPPAAYGFHAAMVYNNLNRDRANAVERMKAKGYAPVSYISSRAFVWPSVAIGEHAFIFEDNTVQPFVTIGNNVVLWSGNHVGHHSVLGDDIFVSSHVVIAGHCRIGSNVFLGVNATFANNTHLGEQCWVAPMANVKGKIPPKSIVMTNSHKAMPLNEEALARALAKASRRSREG